MMKTAEARRIIPRLTALQEKIRGAAEHTNSGE